MSTYQIIENEIVFSNGEKISLPYPIKQSIVLSGNIILLLSVPLKTIYNENVLAFDTSGKFIWQIEKSETLNFMGNCPFLEMEKEEISLRLWNWCGYNYWIDPTSGKILKEEFTK